MGTELSQGFESDPTFSNERYNKKIIGNTDSAAECVVMKSNLSLDEFMRFVTKFHMTEFYLSGLNCIPLRAAIGLVGPWIS